jgi:hypothetical protein
MHDNWEEYYPRKNDERNFTYFGRLYKGYGLLGAYLNPNQKSVFPFYTRRMRDMLDYWNNDYYDFDVVGNIIATDLAKKDFSDISIQSKFIDVHEIKKNLSNWNDDFHTERQITLEERFIKFFKSE